MKKSIDGKEIPSRVWYYILDWKDGNLELFKGITGKQSLNELSRDEILVLFEAIFKIDNLIMKS